VYGSAGVIHALSVVQQLNLTSARAAAWGSIVDGFENATTGFYRLQSVENGAGYEPWHASGWVMAALRILGRRPAYPPAFAQEIALGGPAVWNASIAAMFTAPQGVWSASHKIAAVPGTLMMTDPSWASTYADFFAWFWAFLAANSSPAVGFWCLPPNPMPPNAMCLGGAFHVAFTLACGGQPLPHAEALLNTTLAMQDPVTGLWNGDKLPGYMDQDGVYVTTRSSVQLGKARWGDVERMCAAYVATAAGVLTNASLLLGAGTPFGGIVHDLAGVVTPIAECARWFPGLVVTERPWINTVDIGCFG
jgi:hypothetical protein